MAFSSSERSHRPAALILEMVIADTSWRRRLICSRDDASRVEPEKKDFGHKERKK